MLACSMQMNRAGIDKSFMASMPTGSGRYHANNSANDMVIDRAD